VQYQRVNPAQGSVPAEVVIVSAAPLDPSFPGGFATRHAEFASAVAQQHRTELVYVHDGDASAFGNVPSPEGLADVHVLADSAATGWDDPRIPRQSVARGMRWPSDPGGPLLVAMGANVAHVALHAARSIAVLEEGWERFPPPPGRSPRRRALHAAERLRYRSMYRRVGRSADTVVAITSRERRHFAQFMPEDRICVIPFGVDTGHYAPVPGPAPDIDVLIVGAVNRVEQRVEELVNELRRRPETRDARCVIVGGAPRASVVGLASPTVEVAGYVADVRPYYARAKVVAIPTFLDIGIKTTMLHAWAMERPAVASHAVLAAADHGGSQAHLGVATVEEMGPVIARLLDDAVERRRLGRLARLVVLEHHQEQRSATQFARLVDGALTRPARPRARERASAPSRARDRRFR